MKTLRLIIAVFVVGAGLALGVGLAALALTVLLPVLLFLSAAWGLTALLKAAASERSRRQI